MATYYVRKDRALDGSEGPPDESGLFYWFDGSDAAATDPDAVWTNETNTDDSDTTTSATTTTTGTSATNEIFIEGTDAPASGDTISSVDIFVFYGPTISGSYGIACWTDSKGENLYNGSSSAPQPNEWFEHITLSTPTGGWTWAKIQALEVAVWLQSAGTNDVAAIGVAVHTTTEGQSTTNPFRTIDEAANAVAAGDTVYVGAGTYRELVTMDTSGSSGSVIKFIADIDGAQTGDAGLVVISAYDDSNTINRQECWDPDGRTFVEVYDFVMQGGAAYAVRSTNGTADNYEGVLFENCTFVGGPDNTDGCFYVSVNDATAPTTTGLTIRGCYFQGGTYGFHVNWATNVTADKNLKMTIENCIFNNHAVAIMWTNAGTDSFGSGGLTVTNCTILCQNGSGLQVSDYTGTGYPINVRNCIIFGGSALNKLVSNDGALTSDYNLLMGSLTNVTAGGNDRVETSGFMLGGLNDLSLYRTFGWSPYLPFEPMRNQRDDDWSSPIGDADASVAPATDFYGNPRPMSQAGITQSIYYFDASDAGPTDNDAAWTNDANLFDGSTATFATISTAGTETTNELRGEGTNAPASGGTISKVETRLYGGTTAGQWNYRIYTDGEGQSLSNNQGNVEDSWSTWYTLNEPTGGWTWAKVQALELIFWSTGSPSSDEYGVQQIRVTYAAGNNDDRGAVEGRARPEQETTTVRTGSNAIRFEGAGYHDFLVPVAAQSTTITVYGRYDSNYTGTLPSMTVTNDDIMTEVTDTMAGAANQWEQLTSGAFTPSAAGVVKVRVTSSDTSDTGRAFFDDLVVT